MANLDLTDIAEHYSRMSDGELEHVATNNARGLRPEVLEIIEQEIQKRNINPDILKGAIAQNKKHDITDIENYAELLRKLPCPICGDSSNKLNGTISHTVKSFLIITSYGRTPTIACPKCLDAQNNDAILSTAILGWWGIPWGVLKTPVYIYRNIKAKKQNKLDYANDTMLSYTLGNIGVIETYKDNQQKLMEIIQPK